MRTVRAALIQAHANMSKQESVDKHIAMIADAAARGAQVVGLRGVFPPGPLLRRAGRQVVRHRGARGRPDRDPDAGGCPRARHRADRPVV